MAQIGSRLIDAAAAKIAEDFFKAFEAHLQRRPTRRPAAAGAGAGVPAPRRHRQRQPRAVVGGRRRGRAARVAATVADRDREPDHGQSRSSGAAARRATGSRQGHKVWLVTVIETWGSAPRPPGALLCLRDDGLVVGSVSGGCVEDDLIDRVRHGERVAKPSLITYGVTKEEAARFGLPCGGNLRLVQEPLRDVGWIDEVLARTARHELVARTLRPGHRRGDASSRPRAARRSSSTARSLRALFGPRWRLLIIGAGQLSRVLAQMALALDFEVICCDPREEYHLTWDVPGTTFK